MRRPVINVLGIFFVVVNGALLVAWIGSYSFDPFTPWRGGGRVWAMPLGGGVRVTTWDGYVAFFNQDFPYGGSIIDTAGARVIAWDTGHVSWRWSRHWPWVYFRYFGYPAGSYWTLRFHYLVPFFLTVPPALLWLAYRLRLRRLVRAGYCSKCGYDLRASGERCPECGTAIPPPRP